MTNLKGLLIILLLTPLVSLFSLYWVMSTGQREFHNEIFHQQFERLDVLSKHRLAMIEDFIFWKFYDFDDYRMNKNLNDNRMGFETSRSTEMYLMERDIGNNCYARSQSRFPAFKDHMFRECTHAIDSTIDSGSYRGFSEDYRGINVLSVGKLVTAADEEEKGTVEVAFMTEVDESEVLEVIKPLERRLVGVALLASLMIVISYLFTLTTLFITNRKKEKAEKERDKALEDLRHAVAVFSSE